MNPPLIAIIGPTASGKSDLAMRLAERLSADILSVDSMQVYRHMDIGTAKPTAEDRLRVVHHGIDVVEPTEAFTVAEFVQLADEVIARAAAAGKALILCGGTPLYFKSLFDGLFEGPAPNEALRAELRAQDPAELHRQLAEVDPEAAERIHANDTKRVIRAMEVFKTTGQPISSFQTAWSSGRQRYDATWVGMQWEKETLNRRINGRAKAMIGSGWLEEVRRLPAPLSKTAGEATGYRVLQEHLAGRCSLDEAIEQIKIATRQLARRQMKWFRRFERVRWVDGTLPPEANVAAVEALMSAGR